MQAKAKQPAYQPVAFFVLRILKSLSLSPPRSSARSYLSMAVMLLHALSPLAQLDTETWHENDADDYAVETFLQK